MEGAVIVRVVHKSKRRPLRYEEREPQQRPLARTIFHASTLPNAGRLVKFPIGGFEKIPLLDNMER